MGSYISPEAKQRRRLRQKIKRRAGKPPRVLGSPERWDETILTETWEERKLRREAEKAS